MTEEITDNQLQDVLGDIVRMWRCRYNISEDSGFGIKVESADRGEYTAVVRQYADNPGLCLWLSFSRQGPRPGHCEPVSSYAIDFCSKDNYAHVFDLKKLQDRNRRLELYDFACNFVSECLRLRIEAEEQENSNV